MYKINDRVVTQEEFTKKLAALTMIANSWYCAETSDGGRTGYKAKDQDGILYDVIETSGKENSSIIRQLPE
jgi:hypothetical protein